MAFERDDDAFPAHFPIQRPRRESGESANCCIRKKILVDPGAKVFARESAYDGNRTGSFSSEDCVTRFVLHRARESRDERPSPLRGEPFSAAAILNLCQRTEDGRGI